MTSFWAPGPALVAGPCALEDDRLNAGIAAKVAEVAARLGIRAVFKGSFDKANRRSGTSPRGLGLERGLVALRHLREVTDLPLLTDIHEAQQAALVSEAVDAVQIPAFLCRQTDLLEAAGRTGLPVNIKKGQWLDAASMLAAAEKVRRAGSRDIAVTERGTFFGYGDLVVDMRNLTILKESRAHVLFDATHAVQRPGQGPDGTSAGDRRFVPALLFAAAAAGADGFFIETHPHPHDATSDGATMWPLDRLEELVDRALAVWTQARSTVGVRA